MNEKLNNLLYGRSIHIIDTTPANTSVLIIFDDGTALEIVSSPDEFFGSKLECKFYESVEATGWYPK